MYWGLKGVISLISIESKQIVLKQILNFQMPAEGLELVILLHTQYSALRQHQLKINDDSHLNFFCLI